MGPWDRDERRWRGLLFTLLENTAAQAFWRRALAGAADVEESSDATRFAFRS